MLSSQATPAKSLPDNLGVCASLLCAVHCAAGPLIFLMIPAFGAWWSSPFVHILAALFVVPLAGTVLFHGMRRHGQTWIFVTGLFGCGLIVAALFPVWDQFGALQFGDASLITAETLDTCCPTFVSGEESWSLTLPWESIITFVGSMFLISGHVGNARALRKLWMKQMLAANPAS